jgi:hypothetical protein
LQPNLKFNWGAFVFTPVFGFATKQWFCLLSLIAPISFIVSLIAGFLAPQRIYESGYYSSVEEFNAVMDSWNRAGKFAIIFTLLTTLSVFFLALFVVLLFSAVYTGDAIDISKYARELVLSTNMF